MTILQEMFSAYLQSPEYMSGEPESLTEAREAVEKTLGAYPDEVGTLALESEEYGFVNGFRQAMRIAAACFPTVVEVES